MLQYSREENATLMQWYKLIGYMKEKRYIKKVGRLLGWTFSTGKYGIRKVEQNEIVNEVWDEYRQRILVIWKKMVKKKVKKAFIGGRREQE